MTDALGIGKCIFSQYICKLYIEREIYEMSRMFASKSMFGSGMMGYETKSMINPVSGSYGIFGSGGGGGGTITITDFELESITSIQRLYTLHLADKTYTEIPTDYSQYLKLREVAYNAAIKYQHIPALAVLFQITVDGITGAINIYGLNTLNTELQVQNIYLQTVLEEIINGVNVTKAFDETNGTLSMRQNFQLAPLFRYYISIYGLPEPGVGFDPVKLSVVLTALENSGIDPYA
jgi:hypothetical protein